MISMLRGFMLIVFLFTFNNAYSQFSIRNQTKAESLKNIDTPELPSKVKFEYMNSAQLKQLKKDDRKTKNYYEFSTGVGFTQFGYFNWAAGGENSFNGKATIFLKQAHTVDKFNITSFFNSAYGLGDRYDRLWKTEDWFELNSMANYKLHKRWNYSLSFSLNSQFANGYNSPADTVPVSHFMAPGKFNLSLGLTYKIDDKRYVQISPIGGGLVVVNNKRLSLLGAYGVTPGRKAKASFGATVTSAWEQPIIKTSEKSSFELLYKGNMLSYYDYSTMPTLRWNSELRFGFLKYFFVNLTCQLLFDDKANVPGKSFWQFSETINFGIAYKFKNK